MPETSNDSAASVQNPPRKTNVEQDAVDKKGSIPGTVAGNPNATPNAQTSGANSPRK